MVNNHQIILALPGFGKCDSCVFTHFLQQCCGSEARKCDLTHTWTFQSCWPSKLHRLKVYCYVRSPHRPPGGARQHGRFLDSVLFCRFERNWKNVRTVGLSFLHLSSLWAVKPGPGLPQMMDCVWEVPLAPMVSLSVPSSASPSFHSTLPITSLSRC